MSQVSQVNLKIVHAGSLRKPVAECLDLYCKHYPGVKVELFAAGSIDAAGTLLGLYWDFNGGKGVPIEFALGIAKNSPNKKYASSFVNLLTGGKGQKILEDCGFTPC